jgi:hypothetical protein
MSGLGARHVWEMPLESGLEAGYAWLTREKRLRDRTCLASGPDMSDQSLWNPARGADMLD